MRQAARVVPGGALHLTADIDAKLAFCASTHMPPPSLSSTQAARVVPGGAPHLTADIDAKLAYYAACGADEAFPEFTGGLVAGRYSRERFSPDDARARHADVVARLAAVLGLCRTEF